MSKNSGRSGGGPGSPSGGKASDRELWEKVVRNVAPIARPRRSEPPAEAEAPRTGAKNSGRSGDVPGSPSGKKTSDHELWEEFARNVAPIARPRRSEPSAETEAPRNESKPANAETGEVGKKTRPKPPSAPRPEQSSPPALGAFDRKTRQNFMRGKVEIDARLDLHGHSVARARDELLRFIVSARAGGLRTVLVITGKGSSPHTRHTLHGADYFQAPERRGILRRKLPEWLEESEFRVHVSGWQPAHPKHGGGGASYVRLRRKGR